MSKYITTIGGHKLAANYNADGQKLLTATDLENILSRLKESMIDIDISGDTIIVTKGL